MSIWAAIKKAVNSNLDTPLDYLIGQRTDAANSGGSVHAKIRELRSYVNTVQKPRGTPVKGSFDTAETSYVNVLNINNSSGRLVMVKFNSSGSNNSVSLRITIDGTLLLEESTNTTSPYSVNPFGITSGEHNIDLNFKQSLKIEIRSGPSGRAYVYWVYELE